jgi:hypothetical protein
MVDFNKRLKKSNIEKKINPSEIYNLLDRRSETGPLRPSQEEILKDWYENRVNEKDHIIKLHTGDGKTLIGLLILQSKLNSGKGPCVFVCPNIYLAKQVIAEAKKFGINHCYIGENNLLPDEFIDGQSILITYVQKIFNGKSIFGINNNSTKIGAIILDDSHACIDSIINSLTIKIKQSNSLYTEIINLFENELKEQGEGSFLEIESGDYNTMLPIPYWIWFDKVNEITSIILNHKEDDEIKFIWPLIKDSIDKCQAFVSGNYIEITPFLIPINVSVLNFSPLI